MPRPLDPEIIAEKNKLAQAAWVWLADIQIANGQILYATSNNERLTYNGREYHPIARFKIGASTEENTGTPASRTITITNVNRVLGAMVRQARGLVGRPVALREVCPSHIDNPDAMSFEGFYTIKQAEGDRQEITLTLSLEDLANQLFPQGRMYRTCEHVFGGPKCGKQVALGSIKTCSNTFQGANGCEAHGEDERLNGLEVIHPRRFGGFLGLPRAY